MLHLTLAIDPTADPVAGTLRTDQGPALSFTGWTQLGHVLDEAIGAARLPAALQGTSTAADIDTEAGACG